MLWSVLKDEYFYILKYGVDFVWECLCFEKSCEIYFFIKNICLIYKLTDDAVYLYNIILRKYQ